jgi:uncharacterized protein (TIGR02246 family)
MAHLNREGGGAAMFAWRLPLAAVALILTSAVLGAQKHPVHRRPQSAVPKQQDREGIETLQKREITASMGFDVDALLDLWTDDGVLLPPHHQPIVGRTALKHFVEGERQQYANHDMLAYNEQWDEVMFVGEYAYQWGTVSYRLKPPTGREIEGAVRALRILKREEDGAWRVARAMWNEAPPAGK